MMRNMKKALMAVAAMMPVVAQAQAPAAPAVTAPAPRPAMPDPWAGKKKLLVIADVQTGWHHDSINHAMGVIEQMGREHGEWVTVIRTDSQLITKAPITGQGTRYAGKPVGRGAGGPAGT